MGETAPTAETTQPRRAPPWRIRRPGRPDGDPLPARRPARGRLHACSTSPSTATAGPTSRPARGRRSSSSTASATARTRWRPVVEELAEHYTVIAPDLLGHGRSEKPRADYSVAGFANGMRDLLSVLEVDRVTVVGHSLGRRRGRAVRLSVPAIAASAWSCVGSGGVGRTVSPLLAHGRRARHRGPHAVPRPAARPLRQPPGRRAAAALRHRPRARRRGDPGRVRRAAQHGGPHGDPAHAPLERRLERPGHHHGGPGLSGRGHPDPDHLGPARRHHPAGPRAAHPHGDAGQRVRDLRRGRALSPPHRPGALRARPARVHGALHAGDLRPERWRERLRRGARTSAADPPPTALADTSRCHRPRGIAAAPLGRVREVEHAEAEEEVLHGGVANRGLVVRVGPHVLRPSNPHSQSIFAFLRRRARCRLRRRAAASGDRRRRSRAARVHRGRRAGGPVSGVGPGGRGAGVGGGPHRPVPPRRGSVRPPPSLV